MSAMESRSEVPLADPLDILRDFVRVECGRTFWVPIDALPGNHDECIRGAFLPAGAVRASHLLPNDPSTQMASGPNTSVSPYFDLLGGKAKLISNSKDTFLQRDVGRTPMFSVLSFEIIPAQPPFGENLIVHHLSGGGKTYYKEDLVQFRDWLKAHGKESMISAVNRSPTAAPAAPSGRPLTFTVLGLSPRPKGKPVANKPCPECAGTGVYVSQITGKKSPCSLGCKQ